MSCFQLQFPFLLHWVFSLVLLLVPVSSFAISDTPAVTDVLSSDCNTKYALAMAEYTGVMANAIAANCNITSNTAPECRINMTATADCSNPDVSYVDYSFEGSCPPENTSITSYLGDNGDGTFNAYNYFACEVSNEPVCPSNSQMNSTGTGCVCNPGFYSYNDNPTACELERDDPCPLEEAQCDAQCGGADKKDVFQCNSDRGELVGNVYCHCTAPQDDSFCDPSSGADCATKSQQIIQTSYLEAIKNATVSHSNGLNAIDNSITSQTDTLSGLLTQILNSDGVKNAGSGGGGTTNVDLSGTNAKLDAINDKLTLDGSSSWAHTIPSRDTSGYEAENSALVEGYQQQVNDTLSNARSFLQSILQPPANSGNGHLPCFKNIPLVANQHFDLCFSDYEDKLAVIPLFVYGFGFLLAGVILMRR